MTARGWPDTGVLSPMEVMQRLMLAQALQYPFRGKGSFRSVLILALLQLLPVVGQVTLLGYGVDIVRAVSAGQTNLPPLRWRAALSNGCRLLLLPRIC